MVMIIHGSPRIIAAPIVNNINHKLYNNVEIASNFFAQGESMHTNKITNKPILDEIPNIHELHH
jgi:hypothetical protein